MEQEQPPPTAPPPPVAVAIAMSIDNTYNALAAVDKSLAGELFPRRGTARPGIVKVQCAVRQLLARKRVASLFLAAFERDEAARREKQAQQIADGMALVEMSAIAQRMEEDAILERHRDTQSAEESARALKMWNSLPAAAAPPDPGPANWNVAIPSSSGSSKSGAPAPAASLTVPVASSANGLVLVPPPPSTPRPKYARRPLSKQNILKVSADSPKFSKLSSSTGDSTLGDGDDDSGDYGWDSSSGGDGGGGDGVGDSRASLPNSAHWKARAKEFQCDRDSLLRLRRLDLKARIVALELLLEQVSGDVMVTLQDAANVEESASILRITAAQLIERINPGGVDIKTGGKKKVGWRWASKNTVRKHFESL